MYLYSNLLFEVFPKISEKYHFYLRNTSLTWKIVSKRLISVDLGKVDCIGLEQTNIVEMIRKRYGSHLNDCVSHINDKILIKIMLENKLLGLNTVLDWAEKRNFEIWRLIAVRLGAKIETIRLDNNTVLYMTSLNRLTIGGRFRNLEYLR